MEKREPRIYISKPTLPSYDFEAAAGTIPEGTLREVFLRHESGMSSRDPDTRWTVVDNMKVMARQEMLDGVHEYRQAALGILQETIAHDPSAEVREKAKATADLIRHMEEPEVAEP